MKGFSSIILVILFLLPTIGLHIDLTRCCGGLQELGIAHELKVSVTDCCDMERDASCAESTELLQPPIYLTFAAAQEVQIPLVHVLYTTVQEGYFTKYFQESSVHLDNCNLALTHNPPQSLFQVFLC